MQALADFEGAWVFRRHILHATGDEMWVQGRAEFSPDGTGLTCRETGEMTLADGQRLRASRTYLWRDGLRVLFEDGRYFHTVPQGGGAAEHWCDPDMYRVRYWFDVQIWQANWTVKGPAKDYVMRTLYARDQEVLNTSAFRQ